MMRRTCLPHRKFISSDAQRWLRVAIPFRLYVLDAGRTPRNSLRLKVVGNSRRPALVSRREGRREGRGGSDNGGVGASEEER
jgi:hypothetical protein